MTRRRVENGVQELWFYLRAELHKAADRLKSATAGDATLAEQIDAMLEDTGDMHRSVGSRSLSALKQLPALMAHQFVCRFHSRKKN